MFDKWLLFNTNKPKRDPFANRKTVSQWLSTLSGTDTAVTHEQIVTALMTLRNRDGKLAETDRLEAIMAIDDYAQPLLHTLCTQYLRNSRMSSAMEAKLWRSIYSYYSELTYAYYSAINLDAIDPGLKALDILLPKICLRALHNLGHLFKWRFIHYDLPDEELWRMLHKIYQIAEIFTFANQLIPLYNTIESRCANQFVRALLLSQIHASGLQAKQIEMADIWLLKWMHLVEIEKTPTVGRHHFFVDLAKPSGAELVTDRSYPKSCRCWDASTLLGQLHRTREEIKTQKPNSTSESDARLPEYLKMLTYIELQWTPGNLGKLRKTPRIAAKKMLHVVHGFYIICAAIKDSDTDGEPGIESDFKIRYDEMIDIQLYGFVTEATRNRQQQSFRSSRTIVTPHESWEAENESAKGYLARTPSPNNDWLRLGCLAGVKEDNEGWKVAVVRRLSRDRNKSTHVGMEVLAHKPALLMLHTPQSPPHASTSSISAPSSGSIMALMVSPLQNGHFSLIIDSVQYSRERQFKTTLEQKSILIRLDRVLEKGDSWIYAGASLVT
ncbi:MAG: hypothetical protein ACYCSS_00765 [Sulfuriferula sp.]